MRVFISRKDKTTISIKEANKRGAYLVVKDTREASRVHRIAIDMGVNILFPITFNDILNDKMKGSFVRNIVIDNADMFIKKACDGLYVDLITLDEVLYE